MDNRAPGAPTRRDLLRAGLAAPLAFAGRRLPQAGALGPPPYTISINIEIMFRGTKLDHDN